MVDVKPFLSLHPHHGHMEDSEIDEDLGPYAASLTHFIDYSHIYLMAKETSERIGGDSRQNHIEEMVLDHIVFELHMVGEVVISLSCWVLNLLIEVTSIYAHKHRYLTQT